MKPLRCRATTKVIGATIIEAASRLFSSRQLSTPRLISAAGTHPALTLSAPWASELVVDANRATRRHESREERPPDRLSQDDVVDSRNRPLVPSCTPAV